MKLNNDDTVVSKSSNIDRQREIESHCTRFEKEWDQDFAEPISSFVEKVSPALQAELVIELVAIDCELRHAASQTPKLEEYQRQLPQWRAEAAEGFAAWRNQDFDETIAGGVSSKVRVEPLSTIGDYKIIREIGRGGMGTVYEAEQRSLARRVAIKTLARSNISSLVMRFEREARAVARLHHTNIIEVFGSGVDQGLPYIAMQFVDGQSLSEWIERAKSVGSTDAQPLGPLQGAKRFDEIANIGYQVASALEHAHQKGVLHRDIKPSNLLIDEDNNAWVSDFGLAKLRNDDSDATVAGSIIGTLRYLPPESFNGGWDERSDVYSLGLTLYELVTLRPAFVDREQNQLMHRIVHGGELDSMRSKDASIPRDLDTIVLKAAARDPKARYQSAGLMADDLRRFLSGETVHARRASVMERAWKWSKRKPALASLMALIAAVVVFGFPTLTMLWRRAEMARTEANHQRQLADDAATKARVAANDARLAEADAVEARDWAETMNYGVSMQLAQKHAQDGATHEVKRILDQWNPSSKKTNRVDRRDWEWEYLRQQSDTASLSLGTQFPYAWAVAVRPDDRQIASIHGMDVTGSGVNPVICLWNADSGELQYELTDASSRMFGLSYSPDGKQLATIGFNLNAKNWGTLSLWDPHSGAKIKTVELSGKFNERHINGFYGERYLPIVSYSRDEKYILVGPQPCQLLDANTLNPVLERTLRGRTISFLGEDKIIGHGDGRFFIYSLSSGEKLEETQFRENVNHLQALTAGKHLAFTTMTDARIVDAQGLSVQHKFNQPLVGWCEISPDGQRLAYGNPNGVVSIESLNEPGSPIRLLGHHVNIVDGQFGHKEDWLVTASLDGTVKKWDFETCNPSQAYTVASNTVAGVAFASDGKSIHYACPRIKGRSTTGTIDLRKGDQVTSEIECTYSSMWPRGDFAFSRDGSLLAAPESEIDSTHFLGNSHSGKLCIWDTGSWTKLQTLDVGDVFIICVAWNGNSSVAVGCIDPPESPPTSPDDLRSSVKYFSIDDDPKLVGEVRFNGEVLSVACKQDDLAIGSSKGIEIFRLIGEDDPGAANLIGLERRLEIQYDGIPVDMDYAPTEDRLAVLNMQQEEFSLFDSRSGESLYTSPAPSFIRNIRFSPSGKRIAVVGIESRVFLYDSKTGIKFLELRGSDVSAGSFGINVDVAFSSDGKQIACNTVERKIRVWKIRDEIQYSESIPEE